MKSLILAVAAAVALGNSATAQTIILVRHAEKADTSADPLLSEAGQTRGMMLARAVADAGVTHVFATPLQRTGLTGAPTAAAAGIQTQIVSLDGGGPAHVARLAGTLRTLGPDDVALVVGHSNTVPEIARALGVAAIPAMSECEYDRLILIDLAGGRTRAVTSRYGAPTTPC